MSEKFTASNGVKVWLDVLGAVRTDAASRVLLFPGSHTVALREFFLHGAGLWRDQETGLLVERVPDNDDSDGRAVRIVGKPGIYWEALSRYSHRPTPEERAVVARYFAAHPVLKPWHSAEPGELWNVKVDGWDVERMFVFALFEGLYCFQTETETHIPVTDERIVSAVRIYPEEEQ